MQRKSFFEKKSHTRSAEIGNQTKAGYPGTSLCYSVWQYFCSKTSNCNLLQHNCCLRLALVLSVWRKSLISDRRSLIDWSPAGCLHPSPFQPPPPASQLIDCYKVFAPSRSLSRPLLSETVFHSFSYIKIQIYIVIFFCQRVQNVVEFWLVWMYKNRLIFSREHHVEP